MGGRASKPREGVVTAVLGNDELLGETLALLSLPDLLNAGQVCQRWRRLAGASLTSTMGRARTAVSVAATDAENFKKLDRIATFLAEKTSRATVEIPPSREVAPSLRYQDGNFYSVRRRSFCDLITPLGSSQLLNDGKLLNDVRRLVIMYEGGQNAHVQDDAARTIVGTLTYLVSRAVDGVHLVIVPQSACGLWRDSLASLTKLNFVVVENFSQWRALASDSPMVEPRHLIDRDVLVVTYALAMSSMDVLQTLAQMRVPTVTFDRAYEHMSRCFLRDTAACELFELITDRRRNPLRSTIFTTGKSGVSLPVRQWELNLALPAACSISIASLTTEIFERAISSISSSSSSPYQDAEAFVRVAVAEHYRELLSKVRFLAS